MKQSLINLIKLTDQYPKAIQDVVMELDMHKDQNLISRLNTTIATLNSDVMQLAGLAYTIENESKFK